MLCSLGSVLQFLQCFALSALGIYFTIFSKFFNVYVNVFKLSRDSGNHGQKPVCGSGQPVQIVERERGFIGDRILQFNMQTVILKFTHISFIMLGSTSSALSIWENFCTFQCLHGKQCTSLVF